MNDATKRAQDTRDTLKAMMRQDRSVCGVYSADRHELALFRAAPGGDTFRTWKAAAGRLIDAVTKKRLVTGHIVRDTSAPSLVSSPAIAALYAGSHIGYLPCVNVLQLSPLLFDADRAAAQRLASECNLIMTRDGRKPEPGEVEGLLIDQQEDEERTGAGGIRDLCERYNRGWAKGFKP